MGPGIFTFLALLAAPIGGLVAVLLVSFFRWIRSRFPLAPINRVVAVDFDDQELEFRWAGGSTASLRWDEIQRVLIRTTDRGPFDDDVFFVVEAAGEHYVIPQGSAGTEGLLERLQRLPGFDNEAVINSMLCTDNKQFLCWERVSTLES